MSIACPHCGGEIVGTRPPHDEIARRLLEQERPWTVVDADNREAQMSFRRKPVVYMLMGEQGELLYIGKTSEPTWRWQQHRRLRPWWTVVRRIAVLVMSDPHSAYVAEQRLIQQMRPTFNQRGVG